MQEDEMALPQWLNDVDWRTPNAARAFDHLCGGVHNFEADRRFAEQAYREWPGFHSLANDHRAFRGRAVRRLAAAGIRQFLDLGCGVVGRDDVHEIAQSAASDADVKVVYVDLDPVVVAHARYVTAANQNVTAIRGDVRQPRSILLQSEVTDLLDLAKPIAVLLVAVLEYLADNDDPAGIVAQFGAAAAAGSFLCVSHTIPTPCDADRQDRVRRLYEQIAAPMHLRTADQVRGLLEGWEPVSSGPVPVTSWHPDPNEPYLGHRSHAVAAVAVVAAKPPFRLEVA
ncbi:SAM-dependent methyltransferase [Dactylosporangium darangshiense]|uniref:SAM-dependent methyltransferase n=1 Tax=Dactylosporangium darangshiense TaxID=579108 RepID=A0ABP8DTU2_9ACTN